MSKNFALDLTRICKKYKSGIKVVVQKITLEAFKRIILRTPVDTGRARANWQVSVGSIGTTYEIEATDKSGRTSVATATRTVTGWDCTGFIFMSNSVPYITILEYGRDDGTPGSAQAPEGMVRLTLTEMEEWARRVKI